jgi:hypothetical protein
VHAHTFSKHAEKFKHTSARKLMATVFFERSGVLMVEFMQQETTLSSEIYCETLKKLRRVSHSEQRVWNADIRCSAPP